MIYKILILIAIISGILSGIFLYNLWLIQVILWLTLSLVIYLIYVKNLKKSYKSYYLLIFSGYLIIESILKLLIYNAASGLIFLNTLEHLLWSFSFAALIYYPLKTYLKERKPIFFLIILIALVNLIGVGNELVEYITRSAMQLKDPAYYSDTIRDMFLNIVGSGIFSIFILIRNRLRS